MKFIHQWKVGCINMTYFVPFLEYNRREVVNVKAAYALLKTS